MILRQKAALKTTSYTSTYLPSSVLKMSDIENDYIFRCARSITSVKISLSTDLKNGCLPGGNEKDETNHIDLSAEFLKGPAENVVDES